MHNSKFKFTALFFISLSVTNPAFSMSRKITPAAHVQKTTILDLPNDVIQYKIIPFLIPKWGIGLESAIKDIRSLSHSNKKFLHILNDPIITDRLINMIARRSYDDKFMAACRLINLVPQGYYIDPIEVACLLRTSSSGKWLKENYKPQDYKDYPDRKYNFFESFLKDVETGKTGKVSFLLTFIPELAKMRTKYRYHETALHAASAMGHTQIVKKLIESGADVNKSPGAQPPPIHRAATFGHTEIVKLLLDAGADQSPSYYNETALGSAISNNRDNRNAQVIELLKSRMTPARRFWAWLADE